MRPGEVEGRQVKAAALAAWLDARDYPPCTGELLSDVGRRAVARLAGVRPASPRTWTKVAALLAPPRKDPP